MQEIWVVLPGLAWSIYCQGHFTYTYHCLYNMHTVFSINDVTSVSLHISTYIHVCCSLLSVALIKPWAEATWGEEGLFNPILYNSPSKDFGQELKAGTGRQEMKQRPQKNAAYWLAPSSLLSYLSYAAQANLLKLVPLTWGWALSHQLRKHL